MKDKLPVTQENVLRRIEAYTRRSPEGLEGMSLGAMIRLLRTKLRMTQGQLAKRAGMPQSHVAKMEGGLIDVQLGTLRKVFLALGCHTLILPKPKKKWNTLLEEQIHRAAFQRVQRMAGNMALEKQQPDDATLSALVKAEASKLRKNMTSGIWEA